MYFFIKKSNFFFQVYFIALFLLGFMTFFFLVWYAFSNTVSFHIKSNIPESFNGQRIKEGWGLVSPLLTNIPHMKTLTLNVTSIRSHLLMRCESLHGESRKDVLGLQNV